MIKISKRCMDFLRNFTRGIDDVMNNPNVDPETASQAVANAMVKSVQYQDLRQSIGSFIRNNYLFNLGTAVKNFVGNMARAIEVPMARVASGRPREAADILIGYSRAFNKVFPRFIGGFRNVDIELDTVHMRKFDIARGVLKTDPSENVDKYLNRPVNAFLTFPQNFQRGVDESFATLFEHAQAEVMLNRIKRQAQDSAQTREFLARKGKTPERFVMDIEEAIRKGDPEEPVWKILKDIDPELSAELDEFSRYGTFRTKLGSSMIDEAASSVVNFVNRNPEFASVLPFIITPTNIAKFGAGYVPGLGFARMRQGMKDISALQNQINGLNEKLASAKSPQAAKKITDRIEKLEGEITFKRDLNRDFVGQQILGAGFIATAYGLVSNGELTGAYPADPGRRNAMMTAGMPEFSVKLGGRWISYAGIEPLQTILGLTANSFDTLRQAQLQGKSVAEIGIDIGNTIKAAFVDKTFTQQLSDMLLALQEPNRLEAFSVSLTNGLMPSFMYQIARLQDPIKREIRDPEYLTWITNNLKQRIPGVRETLPTKYNMLGEPAPVGPAGGIATGIPIRPAAQTEVEQLFNNPNLKVLPPSRVLYGVELTGEQYSQMTQIMGELTNQTLSYLVQNPGFQALPEFSKAYFVSGLISNIRSNVRLQMIGQLPLSDEQRNSMIRKEIEKRGFLPEDLGIVID